MDIIQGSSFNPHVSEIGDFIDNHPGIPEVADIVPVVIHVIRKSDGTRPDQVPINQTSINEQIFDRLNTDFAPLGIEFIQCGDIKYIDSDALAEINSPSLAGKKPFYDASYDSEALNIYIFKDNRVSHAVLPCIITEECDGIYPDNVVFMSSGSIYNSTMTHEVGHTYGLFHTFGPAIAYTSPPFMGIFGDHPYNDYVDPKDKPYTRARELVIRTYSPQKTFDFPNAGEEYLPQGPPIPPYPGNPEILGGDFVGDTPADCTDSPSSLATFFPGCAFTHNFNSQTNEWECDYVGTYVDYNGDAISPPPIGSLTNNFMSYVRSPCRTEFTSGQYDRMFYYHEEQRKDQFDQSVCTDNLVDRVEVEGSNVGMEKVLIQLTHPTDDRYTNTITDANGDFNAYLYENEVMANVAKFGEGTNGVGEKKIDRYTWGQWKEGVSTYDLILIQQHLLGLTPLSNGYKKIAADVFKDGKIGAIDLIAMRQLILGMRMDLLDWHNQPWRFTPEYIPQDLSTAFNAHPFDMEINGVQYNNEAPYLEPGWLFTISGMGGKAGFDGIKIGDVDGSVLAPPTLDCIQDEILLTPAAPYSTNEEIVLKWEVFNFDTIKAFQLFADFDTTYLEIMEIGVEELPEIEDTTMLGEEVVNNYHFDNGKGQLAVIWFQENTLSESLTDGEAIFNTRFRVKQGFSSLAEKIYLSTDNGETAFFSEDGCEQDVSLELEEVSAADPYSAPDVFTSSDLTEQVQCFPNPFFDDFRLVIDVTAPHEQSSIQFFDGMGKLIQKHEIDLVEGRNILRFEGNSFPSSSVITVVVQTGENRMITRLVKQ